MTRDKGLNVGMKMKKAVTGLTPGNLSDARDLRTFVLWVIPILSLEQE